jgi:hypothetical protein
MANAAYLAVALGEAAALRVDDRPVAEIGAPLAEVTADVGVGLQRSVFWDNGA